MHFTEELVVKTRFTSQERPVFELLWSILCKHRQADQCIRHHRYISVHLPSHVPVHLWLLLPGTACYPTPKGAMKLCVREEARAHTRLTCLCHGDLWRWILDIVSSKLHAKGVVDWIVLQNPRLFYPLIPSYCIQHEPSLNWIQKRSPLLGFKDEPKGKKNTGRPSLHNECSSEVLAFPHTLCPPH